jgi:hypothetical protein
MKLQNPYFPPTPGEALDLVGGIGPGRVCWADPIAKAVDDWLLMERKARAWDELRQRAEDWAAIEITLAEMDALVHPAQNPSTC